MYLLKFMKICRFVLFLSKPSTIPTGFRLPAQTKLKLTKSIKSLVLKILILLGEKIWLSCQVEFDKGFSI